MPFRRFLHPPEIGDRRHLPGADDRAALAQAGTARQAEITAPEEIGMLAAALRTRGGG